MQMQIERRYNLGRLSPVGCNGLLGSKFNILLELLAANSFPAVSCYD
jgi:hypothetical protein